MNRHPFDYEHIIKFSPEMILNISKCNPEFSNWYPSEILIAQSIIAMGED